MPSVLKGNFYTKKSVNPDENQKEDLDTRFEREALKRLGGSISFVRKKKIAWGDGDTGDSK